MLLWSLLAAGVFASGFLVQEKVSKEEDVFSCKDCNIVMISMTNTRTDHMSAYGYDKNTTPNVSKLADRSIVFTSAFTQASRTIAAGLSLMTSQYPYSHGVLDRWYSKKDLNPNAKTLAEILKNHGYKTAAFTGGGHYKGIFGFDKGFDVYEDSQDFIGFAPNVQKAIDWMRESKDDKFLLFLQGFGAHCPYFPPEPYDAMFDPDYENKSNIDYYTCYWSYKGTDAIVKGGEKKFPLKKVVNWGGETTGDTKEEWQEELFSERDIEHLISLYDGSIAYEDLQVGKMLDAINGMGLDENTIVVFTSEHGELLGEGRFMRGGYLTGTYRDEVLKIPLIMRYPKMNKGRKIDGLVQTIDILPTLLASLGIGNYEEAQGKSLLPLMKSGNEINEYVYAGALQYRNKTYRHFYTGVNEVDMVRSKEWKLVKETVVDYDRDTTTDSYELYNIRKDPHELNNVIEKELLAAEELKEKLTQWINSLPTPEISTNPPPQSGREGDGDRLLEAGKERGYW